MPDNSNKSVQGLVNKIAAMNDKDANIMLLLMTAYAAGKAAAEQKAS